MSNKLPLTDLWASAPKDRQVVTRRRWLVRGLADSLPTVLYRAERSVMRSDYETIVKELGAFEARGVGTAD
jgi:hypothetical protein